MKQSPLKFNLIFNDSNHLDPDAARFISDRLIYLLTSQSEISLELSEKNPIIDIYLDSMSPFIDERLIIEVIKIFHEQSVKVTFIRGISGSIPLSISVNGGKVKKNFYVGDQGIGGVNFKIGRNVRKKIFFSLVENFPKFKSASFQDIIYLLNSEEVSNLVLNYGEKDINIYSINECPNCSSHHLLKIYHTEGNVKGGFLPNKVSFYSRCHKCELVFMSKQVNKEDFGIFYRNEVYDRSGDSTYHKNRWANLSEKNSSHYANFLHATRWIGDNYKDNMSIIDLGCGGGDFVALTKNKFPKSSVTGFDWHLPGALKNALSESDINYISGPISVEGLSSKNYSNINLVTMWEVIEHIKINDLRDLLDHIHSILDEKGALIISTPDFDDKHSQSLDFWSMAPGEHLSVFTEPLIRQIFSEHRFNVQSVERESVTIKLPNEWYQYGEDTNTNHAGSASAAIIEDFLKDPHCREWYKDFCRKSNIGSEMVIVASKQI